MSDAATPRNATPPGNGTPPEIPAHTLLRRIGRGSFGEVWLARTVLGAYRAVKIVYRDSFEHDRPYEREFNGIQNFEPISRTHQGFVDILQVGRNDEKGYFYYVMELADDASGGPLIDPSTYTPRTLHPSKAGPRRLPFEECVRLGISLTSAAGYLHRHNLVHRDIKPANIIFVNDAPKLADVGLVTTVDAKTFPGGTLGFVAPELLTDPQAVPNQRTDVYSLGKVLYEISTGKDRQDFPELPTAWIEAEEIPKLIELNEVILKACENEPADRYQSMAELEAELVLLQSGKSVKRLRALERRVALLTRAALAVALLAAVASVAYYQVRRSRHAATERLATAYIKAGADSIENKGDTFEALLRYTEALRLHQGDAEREKSDRVRLATTLGRCPRLLRMWFQDKVINDVAFSPDGKRVVAAGGDGRAVVWEMDHPASSRPLLGHRTDKEIESAAFDPTGQLIVTASGDRTVRVWDSASGLELVRLDHSNTVYAVQFSPVGPAILTAGADKVARVWDWLEGTVQVQFTNHTKPIRHAAFSPDGALAVTASEDTTARLWDAQTGKQIGSPLQHGTQAGNWVYHAAFSPDGQRLATGCFDQRARLWDVATGELKEDPEYSGVVRSIEFSPDGRYLLVACWDRTTRLWDTSSRKPAGPPIKTVSKVNRARFSPDGTRLVTGDIRGVVCVWALPPINWRPPSLQAAFSADGRRYAVASACRIEVRDAGTDALVGTVLADATLQKTLLSADGSRLLVLSTNTDAGGQLSARAQLWDVTSTQALSWPFPCGLEVPGAGRLAPLAQLSREGTRLVTAANKAAQVWDTTTGRPVGVPLVFTNWLKANEAIKQVTLSPDARSLGAVAAKWVFIIDVPTGTNRLALPHPYSVEHAEFSPDGRKLVTACSDGTNDGRPAQVWDAFTGRPIGAPLWHLDGVVWAAFSPDGRLVATGSEDYTARIWDAATGARRMPPLKHGGEVWFAGFSPDGRWLLTTSRDNTARVWDAATGDPITPPLRHPQPPSSAQFAANGRRIVTRRQAGEAWIWALPADDRSAGDLVRMVQLLSQHRSESIDEVFPLDKAALQELWESLVNKYPEDFTISTADELAWHERETEDAKRDHHRFSEDFHRRRLLEAPLRQ